MKNLLIIGTMCLVFSLASCKALFSPPILEKMPDTISKPTITIVPKDTNAVLPAGSSLVTEDTKKTEAFLTHSTLVEVDSTVAIPTLTPPQTILVPFPKNTSIVLPFSTNLKTSDDTNVTIKASSEVVLPVGTEISITKINWYAILFYMFMVIWAVRLIFNKAELEDAVSHQPKEPDSVP